MTTFRGGREAAATLRAHVLELLGAVREWTEGDHDSEVICWASGTVTTFFYVETGTDGTPDLGVLRVVTPVATVGDRDAALGFCNELNLYATTNRWTIAPGHYNGAPIAAHDTTGGAPEAARSASDVRTIRTDRLPESGTAI